MEPDELAPYRGNSIKPWSPELMALAEELRQDPVFRELIAERDKSE